MARMSADTLKVATAPEANGAKRGRRPQAGNAAGTPTARRQPVPAPESESEAEAASEAAAESETAPEPTPREGRSAVAPAAFNDGEDDFAPTDVHAQPPPRAAAALADAEGALDDTIWLGRLAKRAIAEGQPMGELVDEMRATIAAYERAGGQ